MLNNIKFAFSKSIITRTMSNYIPKDRLKGKVAVISASTDGIGYAIAKRLAQEGANVVISSRKEKNVEKAVSSLKANGLSIVGTVCHVSKAEDRKKLFDYAVSNFGGIDIVVSNAGINPTMGHVFDCDEKTWDKIFDVNVKASFLFVKESLPFLRKRGGGRIIFISSIAGLHPINLLGPYSVSKTAIIGLMKAGAQNLVGENITVNAIAPGIIKTKFAAALYESKEMAEYTMSQIPMGRLGEPEDIGATVAFICSDDAKYMTGETIVVAGGMASRL